MPPRAKKHLGQNFLQDTSVIRRIVDALDLGSSDRVMEIGPGLGALTQELLARQAEVVAIEFDRDMVAVLRERFSENENLTVVNADVLAVDFAAILPEGVTAKVAANLPYNISTPILQRLIPLGDRLSLLVLMFQKEVVDRITARPGDSDRGFLTVLVENAFSVERLFDVPPEAFRPVPKVYSSVVRIRPRSPLVDQSELARVASIGFTHRRKTLLNNLKSTYPAIGERLRTAGVDPARRAETLSLEEWATLIAAIKEMPD